MLLRMPGFCFSLGSVLPAIASPSASKGVGLVRGPSKCGPLPSWHTVRSLRPIPDVVAQVRGEDQHVGLMERPSGSDACSSLRTSGRVAVYIVNPL